MPQQLEMRGHMRLSLSMILTESGSKIPPVIMCGLISIILLIPSLVSAQQNQIVWDQPNVSSPTAAQALQYKFYVTPSGSTVTNSPITLTSVLCGGTTVVQCSTVLPSVAGAANITGAKSELTATDSISGVESPKSIPFIKPAVAPTNLRIIP